jgi:hypothetical protein
MRRGERGELLPTDKTHECREIFFDGWLLLSLMIATSPAKIWTWILESKVSSKEELLVHHRCLCPFAGGFRHLSIPSSDIDPTEVEDSI